jgi:regulatory protein
MTTSRSSGSRRGGPRPAAPGPTGARRASSRPAAAEPPLARAKAVALRWLAAAARTEAQVRSRLDRAGLGAEAEEVVAWLRHLRYLDDEAYARARARALTAPGKLGPRAAERRLLQAGVAPAAARAAVAAALAEAPGGEAARCRALAERRAPGGLAALDEQGRARLARFLLGRGFSGAVVARTLGGFEDRELEG